MESTEESTTKSHKLEHTTAGCINNTRTRFFINIYLCSSGGQIQIAIRFKSLLAIRFEQ